MTGLNNAKYYICYFPHLGFTSQNLTRKYEGRLCALIHSSRTFLILCGGLNGKKILRLLVFIMQASDSEVMCEIAQSVLLLWWLKTEEWSCFCS